MLPLLQQLDVSGWMCVSVSENRSDLDLSFTSWICVELWLCFFCCCCCFVGIGHSVGLYCSLHQQELFDHRDSGAVLTLTQGVFSCWRARDCGKISREGILMSCCRTVRWKTPFRGFRTAPKWGTTSREKKMSRWRKTSLHNPPQAPAEKNLKAPGCLDVMTK